MLDIKCDSRKARLLDEMADDLQASGRTDGASNLDMKETEFNLLELSKV